MHKLRLTSSKLGSIDEDDEEDDDGCCDWYVVVLADDVSNGKRIPPAFAAFINAWYSLIDIVICGSPEKKNHWSFISNWAKKMALWFASSDWKNKLFRANCSLFLIMGKIDVEGVVGELSADEPAPFRLKLAYANACCRCNRIIFDSYWNNSKISKI